MTTATAPTAPTDADLRVLAVACPACGSDPEARCTSPSGRVARSHSARVRAALAATDPAAQAQARAMPGDTVGGTGPVGITVDTHGVAHPRPEQPAPETTGPSTEDLVLRLLVLKVLAGRIAEADGDTRDSTVGRLDVGVSLPGYLTAEDRAAARRGERDRCLGKVGLSRPSESWKVTDVDALTAFVAEHAPDEVEHRPVIRNSFLSVLMASAKANDGTWTHPVTGEVLELPGVELAMGRPTLQVRPSADAADLVGEALAVGLLTADGQRALPAGGAA